MNQSNYQQKCISEKGDECHFCDGSEGIIVHHIDGDSRQQ
jgi:hypothetical protein